MATQIYGKVLPKSERDKVQSVKDFQLIGLGVPVGKNNKLFYKVNSRDLVVGQIKQLIFTAPGERVMLPDFGLDLNGYLFEQITESLKSSLKKDIVFQIERYVPNVEIISIEVYFSSGDDPLSPSPLNAIRIVLDVKEKVNQEVIPLEIVL